jgi:hypothetical protein
MHRSLTLLLIALLVIARLAPTLPAQSKEDGPTAAEVRESIGRGVEYLYSQQYKDKGNWYEHAGQPGGVTALVTMAMLSSGEDPKDPRIQRALQFLRGLDKPGEGSMVYSISLQTMALALAEPERDRLIISRNVRWLESVQIKSGERKGAWGYSSRQGNGDNSNTQFALLALHEAERVGVEVSDQTWKLALNYWLSNQKQDGSWGYFEGQASTGSMTCAGISSVIIASGAIGKHGASVEGDQVRCCGALADPLVDRKGLTPEESVEKGISWLGDHFAVSYNPTAGASGRNAVSLVWQLYYLYGVERVGRMSGRRFFPQRTLDAQDPRNRDSIVNRDWYREGAAKLIEMQNPVGNGYWKGTGHAESNEVIGTSLALLFLSKGRRPVVMSKVRYTTTQDWNKHPQAVANLTRKLEKDWKRDLVWQTFDLNPRQFERVSGKALEDAKEKQVRDMLESPVLFFSGSEDFTLTNLEVESLRRYVDNGGFIFAEACDGNGCNGQAFDTAFQREMGRVFPDSKLRKLPPDHAVWFAQQRIDPKHLPKDMWLYGIDACCRTSVVYCPRSLSCYWELYRVRKGDYPDNVNGEIETCLRIGENVITYATNRELKEKLDRPQVAVTDNANKAEERNVLAVAKLSHTGGADDAPHALANMLRTAEKQVDLRVSTDTHLLAPTDAELTKFPIAFMHGRRSFQWSPNERKALATWLERGGFLLADSICASPQFTESFHREFKAIFPDAKFTRIPIDHPLLTNEFAGFDLKSVSLRDPQNRGGESLEAAIIKTEPYLEALELDGRICVVFSPYDLSCALENQSSLECKGYIKQDAARIGVNVLLYALQQ